MSAGIWIAGTRTFAAEVAGFARDAGVELSGSSSPPSGRRREPACMGWT